MDGTTDTLSEWLRRWTRNPLGSARKGSNPLGVAWLWCTEAPLAQALRHPKTARTSYASQKKKKTDFCLSGDGLEFPSPLPAKRLESVRCPFGMTSLRDTAGQAGAGAL